MTLPLNEMSLNYLSYRKTTSTMTSVTLLTSTQTKTSDTLTCAWLSSRQVLSTTSYQKWTTKVTWKDSGRQNCVKKWWCMGVGSDQTRASARCRAHCYQGWEKKCMRMGWASGAQRCRTTRRETPHIKTATTTGSWKINGADSARPQSTK